MPHLSHPHPRMAIQNAVNMPQDRLKRMLGTRMVSLSLVMPQVAHNSHPFLVVNSSHPGSPPIISFRPSNSRDNPNRIMASQPKVTMVRVQDMVNSLYMVNSQDPSVL